MHGIRKTGVIPYEGVLGFTPNTEFGLGGPVVVSHLGIGFKAFLGDHQGAFDEERARLVVHTVDIGRKYRDIVTMLGGAEKVVTSPAKMWFSCADQNRGQAGPLATNGWPNAFCLPDPNGGQLVLAEAIWNWGPGQGGWMFYLSPWLHGSSLPGGSRFITP
jgi:hypothetical protein